MRHALKMLDDCIDCCGGGFARTAMCDAQVAAKPQAWVASWGASQQIPEPQNALPADDLRDATVRQIFHLSVGGAAAAGASVECVRDGGAALYLGAHCAAGFGWLRRRSIAATDKALTFAGSERCDGSAGCGVCLGPDGVSGGSAVGSGGDISSG